MEVDDGTNYFWLVPGEAYDLINHVERRWAPFTRFGIATAPFKKTAVFDPDYSIILSNTPKINYQFDAGVDSALEIPERTPSLSEDTGLSGGAIAAIIVCVLVLVLASVLLALWILRRNTSSESDGTM